MKPEAWSVRLAALAVLVGAFGVLYADVLRGLLTVWLTDDNYSHGLLVLPVAVYLVWARRGDLAATPLRPANAAGVGVIIFSLTLLLVGTAGVEFFLMRISAVGFLAGAVVFVAGWKWLRQLLFPLSLMALVIPVPPIVFYQAAFPLQVLATKFGVGALELFGIPVLREGNVIHLPQITLEVTEACSGIRSLVSLFSLAVLYGYFKDGRPPAVAIIASASIPIAIFANGLRIAGTGIAAHYIGVAAATGFFHSFSGWIVFMTSFAMLLAVTRLVRRAPPLVRPHPEVSLA